MRTQGERRAVLLYVPMLIMALGFIVLFPTKQSIVGWAALLVAAVVSIAIVVAELVTQSTDDQSPSGP